MISWSDLNAASSAGVWGLGVEGQANLRKLAALGAEPVLVDDHPAWPRARRPAGAGDRRRRAGRAGRLRCGGQDAGHQPLPARGGRCWPGPRRSRSLGGLGLWLAEADRDRVICITGTKGKSSTTAVAGHLLTRWGYRCLVGGNIGQPPWDPGAR